MADDKQRRLKQQGIARSRQETAWTTSEQESPAEIIQALGESELDPFEIEFLPQFEHDRGPREAFVNEYGVVIGDHLYASENSPLEQWTSATDPAIMTGDDWVHPYKDIGFRTEENRNFYEKGIPFSAAPGAIFMHADKDVAYGSEPEPELEHEHGEGR